MKVLKLGSIYKLLVSSKQESCFIPIDKIVCVVSQGNYSILHLVDGTEALVTFSLKRIDEQLRSFGFVRCHKTHLVNIAYVDRWMFKDPSVILLSNNLEVKVSKRGSKKIKELIASCS